MQFSRAQMGGGHATSELCFDPAQGEEDRSLIDMILMQNLTDLELPTYPYMFPRSFIQVSSRSDELSCHVPLFGSIPTSLLGVTDISRDIISGLRFSAREGPARLLSYIVP